MYKSPSRTFHIACFVSVLELQNVSEGLQIGIGRLNFFPLRTRRKDEIRIHRIDEGTPL